MHINMNTTSDLLDVMAEIGPIETLREALALFERVGMPARNLSSRTRAEYKNDLSDLISFLERQGIVPLARISLQHHTNYQAEMDKRGYKPSTRNRKTHAIKSWFKFLYNQGVIGENVANRLIPPRPNKPEPRFLSESEYQRLLRACSHHPRDAAIMEVFLQTGMRLSELARLTLDDIELPARITREPDNTGTVRITRKGGKVDTIPLNYKACQALAAWLKVRPAVEYNALLVSKFRTPLGKRAIQQVVQKYMDEVGIKNASVHTLRHTMATHHIARGTDAKTIQEALGHASLTTTTIYIALAKKAQRKALQEHAL
jgi:site-specific recombinase XerD